MLIERVGIAPLLGLLAVAAFCPATAGAAVNPAKLSIACTPRGVAPTVASTCTATVTDSGPVASHKPPTGAVTFTVQGTGTFDPPEGCSLEEAGAFSSKCSVDYTPTQIAGGEHVLLGTYEGDDSHGRATARFTIDVTPVNDELANASPLKVPVKVSGTTEGATYGDQDPELCSDAYAPVWYSLKPAQSSRVAVRLSVKGQVDAVVAVFRQDRSQLADLGCEVTGASGVAGVPFDTVRGTTYLIAVAAPYDAVSGGFQLETAAVPPIKFPGTRLSRDADVRLDPLLHPGAVFSAQLSQGISYRIAATGPAACVHLAVLRPASRTTDDPLAQGAGCSGYVLFTPELGMGGSYPIVVSMDEGDSTRVHVALRAAGPDDLAPGLQLANGESHRGHLDTRGADVVDVYRFGVDKVGDASLVLRGRARADLLLLDQKGIQLACSCAGGPKEDIVKRLAPGTYFAAVRARPSERGDYALTLRLREPTTTTISLTRSPDGTKLAATAKVSSAADTGRIVFELDRFDPLTQWRFVAAVTRPAGSSPLPVTIRPQLGGWRIRAEYQGSLSASRSASAWVDFVVDTAHGVAPKSASTCGPRSNHAFAAAGMKVTCTAEGFARSSPGTAPAPAAALSSMTKLVSGIPLLKEPFRTNLLTDLADASTAVSNKKPDSASATLGDFITQLQAAPLRAQLTVEQLNRLLDLATSTRNQLASPVAPAGPARRRSPSPGDAG
jgi:hypothetical protein